eukprot:scpid43595/ scgid15728/ Abhydrolase domain-containing protein 16A; HLA-B-associated transcript 5
MDAVRTFYRSIFGPRLLQIFSYASTHQPGHVYQANAVERLGDTMLRCAIVAYGVAYYVWPVILPYMYRKGVFDVASAGPALRVAKITGGILVAAYTLRGMGRAVNPDYQRMIRALIELEKDPRNLDKQLALLQFDITLQSAPVQFQAKRVSSSPPEGGSFLRNCFTSFIYPYSTLKSILVSALGRPMMYPGSTAVLNYQLGPVLMQNRQRLIFDEDGARKILGTIDGNKIDTMFFDRRGAHGAANGDILVIATDGNAAYYEIGGTVACLQSSYSVLGWNHPGFGASTGYPFPSQEQNGIEAVYQYATEQLGFSPDRIMLYSWSIGGYASSFLAQAHPDISSVILDATFDDVTSLAVNRMPGAISWFVKDLVHSCMNLNNAELINRYDGPVTIVRRSKDEMMMTDGTVTSNRGNHLFMSLFKRRFPNLATPATEQFLWTLLANPSPNMPAHCGNASLQEALLTSNAREHGYEYPCLLGTEMTADERNRMAAFIADKVLQHYGSTHCVSLPARYLRKPWTLS